MEDAIKWLTIIYILHFIIYRSFNYLMSHNICSWESIIKSESIITGISELFFLASRGGAAVHTSVVQLADRVGKKLDIQEASQVEVKYALMGPEEVSHQKQLDGYITVDQPVRSWSVYNQWMLRFVFLSVKFVVSAHVCMCHAVGT